MPRVLKPFSPQHCCCPLTIPLPFGGGWWLLSLVVGMNEMTVTCCR